jgi:hypothetical protein
MRCEKAVRVVAAAAVLIASPLVFAQANGSAPNQFGDRQLGNFGDAGTGYFGNPGEGHFTEKRFPRDQEGRVPLAPGIPMRYGRVSTPPPPSQAQQPQPAAPSPYVVLPAPVETD